MTKDDSLWNRTDWVYPEQSPPTDVERLNIRLRQVLSENEGLTVTVAELRDENSALRGHITSWLVDVAAHGSCSAKDWAKRFAAALTNGDKA